MATYWLGEGGNDGNNGTTYALRKLTPASALALLTTKGDILNVVGTVDLDTTNYEINGTANGNAGTSYSDPALIIRGTDSSGDPAMAVLLGDATHTGFLRLDDSVHYSILRGLHFDLSTQPASYTIYPVQISGSGQSPVKFQYCIFEGAADPNISGHHPHFPFAQAIYHSSQPEPEGEVLAEYCYFINARMTGDNAYIVHADHCVLFATQTGIANSFSPFVRQDTNTNRARVGAKMTNCTLDYQHNEQSDGTRHFQIVHDYVTDLTPSRSRLVHSNLICVASSAVPTANQFWNSGMIDSGNLNTTGVWSGTMGYNAIVLDANAMTAIDSTTVTDFYTDHFHPDQPNTVSGTELYPTDVLDSREVISSIINAVSAWTWTDIQNSGYNIDLEKDYRISHSADSNYLTMAEDGGRIGAVQENVNRPPVAIDPTYRADENIVMNISAALGLLNGATDPDAGDTLSITSMGTPAHGTLVSYNITTGSFVYRPDPFYSGADSFTYKVSDGTTNSATATATIFVLPASSAVVTNLIDTAPFFRPSLFVETEFRTKWKKNRKKALNESNYTDGQQWNESTSRSIMLTPSATTTVTLGGVASAKYLILETDQDIEVSIDGTDKYWPVSKVVAVAMTEFASISLHSLSTTNAQVILTVVD